MRNQNETYETSGSAGLAIVLRSLDSEMAANIRRHHCYATTFYSLIIGLFFVVIFVQIGVHTSILASKDSNFKVVSVSIFILLLTVLLIGIVRVYFLAKSNLADARRLAKSCSDIVDRLSTLAEFGRPTAEERILFNAVTFCADAHMHEVAMLRIIPANSLNNSAVPYSIKSNENDIRWTRPYQGRSI